MLWSSLFLILQNYRRSAVYYRTKSFTTYTFLELPRKGYSKFLEILKEPYKTASFSLTLQVCSPESPTLTKTDFKKAVSCDCSEIVGNLVGKDL